MDNLILIRLLLHDLCGLAKNTIHSELSVHTKMLHMVNGACMQKALDEGGKVLVHCSQGVSRSTTLLIAFLMWRSNQAYDDTFQQVKAGRGVANPNIGFICQVQHTWHDIPHSDSPPHLSMLQTCHCQLQTTDRTGQVLLTVQTVARPSYKSQLQYLYYVTLFVCSC